VLAKYSRDLTSLAAEGKLDPVIGRHDETRRLIDVLCRRTKNRCGPDFHEGIMKQRMSTARQRKRVRLLLMHCPCC
jgi:hypothetical protein